MTSAYSAAEGPALLVGFADHGDVSPDCVPSESYLVFLGIVQGSGSAGAICLSPGSSLTRAQAVALILRAETRQPKPATPVVDAVAPAFGPETGGAPVVITGSGFSQAFQVRSDSEIDVSAAPAGVGSVDVIVAGKRGTSVTSGRDVYTYVTTVTPGNDVVQAALAHLDTPYRWVKRDPAQPVLLAAKQ